MPLGPGKVNKFFQTACHKHFNDTPAMVDLIKTNGGSLGSHSIRKYAATHGRQFGHSIGDVDYRGRWKSEEERNHKIVVDSHINPEFEYLDAAV